MTRRDALTLFASGFWQGRVVSAQNSPFSADVSVVDIRAVVRTRAGELVRGLGIGDFAVEESGRRQTIRAFSRGADIPLTLGLLIDTSSSQRRLVEPERQASRTFLEGVLRTEAPDPERQDRAFVMQFNAHLDVKQDITSSLGSLEQALIPVAGPSATVTDIPATRLYDAIVFACEQYMKWEQGRKACIVLTDGIDYGSESTLSAAIESAQRADTPIYSILNIDWPQHDRVHHVPGHNTSNYDDGVNALQRMAQETGGAYFAVSGRRPIERIYDQIEDELRSGYTLGYVPDPSVSGYQTIHVGVVARDSTVQAREGYYAGANAAWPQPRLRITKVDPVDASTGDLVTASGNGLDRSNIDALYLTDGIRTLEVAVLEQTATAIKFRIPEQADSGVWRVGDKRPHWWSIVLQTSNRELLNCVGFRIAID